MLVSLDDFDAFVDERTNLGQQSWAVNKLLGDDPPALVEQKVEWSRPAVDVVLRRSKARGFLPEFTTEGIDLVRDRPDTLNADQLDAIGVNGITDLEDDGVRSRVSLSWARRRLRQQGSNEDGVQE